MNVLYLDFLYPKRHVRQNTAYINLLDNIANIYVLAPKDRYINLSREVKVIENNSLKIKKGRLFNRLDSLRIMVISSRVTRKFKPDYIFIATYETMMFNLGRFFFSNKDKIFLLHHYNIDELENRVKRCFFKMYMKKVDHIVFEDFIKDYLVKSFMLDPNKIHVLPHQLNENLLKTNGEKYSCVGLSNSNDEKIISEIINIENKQQILKKANCKVILKSKELEFDNGYLKIIKGYLDSDEYNEYINDSQSIYMPFPLSFRYRMSGTLVDALSNEKVVLASNIPLIQHYASKYPEVCKVVKSAQDFFEHVLNLDKLSKEKASKDFEQFKLEHSNINIIKSLKKIFT